MTKKYIFYAFVILTTILSSCFSGRDYSKSDDYIFTEVSRNFRTLENHFQTLITTYQAGKLNRDEQIAIATQILSHPYRQLLECDDAITLYGWVRNHRQKEITYFEQNFPSKRAVHELASGYNSCFDDYEKSKYLPIVQQIERQLPKIKSGKNPTNRGASKSLISKNSSLDLSYGNIPFGKTISELKIVGESITPYFYEMGNDSEHALLLKGKLHFPQSVYWSLNCDTSYGAVGIAPGYHSDNMSSILIKDFSQKLIFAQLFFNEPSKTLAVVSKHIKIPFTNASEKTNIFKGLRVKISSEVKNSPTSFEDNEKAFVNEIYGRYRYQVWGQFAYWELEDEVIALVTEFQTPAVGDDKNLNIYIIHGSKKLLDKYTIKRRQFDKSVSEDASKYLDSAF